MIKFLPPTRPSCRTTFRKSTQLSGGFFRLISPSGFIANALEQHPNNLILSMRDFRQDGVPFKSFWGNRITSTVYFLSTGRRCADTQTGLRGIPLRFYDLCQSTPGERYEYEMNLLLTMGLGAHPVCSHPD